MLEIHFIILNALLDARRSAVKYLSAYKSAVSIKNIDQIIEGYIKIVELLESSNSYLAQKTDMDPVKQIEELIKKQSGTLSEVLNHEKVVIRLLEKEITHF